MVTSMVSDIKKRHHDVFRMIWFSQLPQGLPPSKIPPPTCEGSGLFSGKNMFFFRRDIWDTNSSWNTPPATFTNRQFLGIPFIVLLGGLVGVCDPTGVACNFLGCLGPMGFRSKHQSKKTQQVNPQELDEKFDSWLPFASEARIGVAATDTWG